MRDAMEIGNTLRFSRNDDTCFRLSGSVKTGQCADHNGQFVRCIATQYY